MKKLIPLISIFFICLGCDNEPVENTISVCHTELTDLGLTEENASISIPSSGGTNEFVPWQGKYSDSTIELSHHINCGQYCNGTITYVLSKSNNCIEYLYHYQVNNDTTLYYDRTIYRNSSNYYITIQ